MPNRNLNEKRRIWEENALKKTLEKIPERKERFTTNSGLTAKRIYSPEDTESLEYLGLPGEYPFTRGIHPTMYRGRIWTMRQFSGFGAAEETNRRFKYLLEHGETGLSVAFDFPTLIGYDSDDPKARGEVGICGVAVDSLRDMEILFDGIPLDKVSTSMTINGPAAILWAMYITTAEKQGVRSNQLRGTIQNDILKEFMAQKSFIFPPEPSLRLVVDTIEFGCRSLPHWNPISISGYHIREAGASAVQELAFTLANGFTYVQSAIEKGLDIDDFAPRLSFFFATHNDLFEEVAKLRAARRIWAREMREKFKAKKPKSWWMRFHTQTSGATLTSQQPENNVVRVALQALAAVLGGTQSLHTNSLDEALGLPSEWAVRIALRTQQIIAHESGVTNTVDPLGGSYYIEWLTDRMEEEAYRYFDKIEALGGVVKCIERGFFQKEITESAHRYQREVENGGRTVVGVNKYIVDEPVEISVFKADLQGQEKQLRRLERLKKERSEEEVREKLRELEKAAATEDNLMPYILDGVRACATLGEICDVLRQVFGEYEELTVF
ncbi:MAG: methylmalonyl-CoA mutase [Nitrososphaeria archaeon]|nr:methylmalonyl-CoA mutase [Nitrososphaeria archaeon]NIN52166.1 methylmalonyl-CoA mutase [Nitrososphaeria archaeon]NIQ32619.1 methylmalonyl-CoA mutase [Nitrososphaeria archaeon]